MTERRKSISVATVAACAIGATVGSFVVNRLMQMDGDTSIEKALVDASNQFNKMCPMMIDSETRGDTMVPEPPNTLVYRYTLIHLTKADVDVHAIVAYLKPRIINNYKSADTMKALREGGVTLKYRYY